VRASGSPADPGQATAASERLNGLGLAPAPAGWVPDQPASIATAADVPAPAPGPDPGPEAAPMGALLRAAAAERAPLWAGGLIERATLGAALTALAVIVLVVVAGVMFVHHQHQGGGTSYSSSGYSDSPADSPAPDPVPSGVDGAAAGADSPVSIVVDVGGRVRKPGLVTLPVGARVADAIDAAGGPLHRRELDRIDLAQRVTDGQLLLVGVQPAADPGAGTGSPADPTTGPISLSAASIDDLETLPGVGPVTAQKIIDWRTAHGGFTSVEQLQQVSGIGPAHYAEISPLVTP
jgi:competence protein ComEA